jgi:hypothetical protein
MFEKKYEENMQENENIGRGSSWWRLTPVRERRSRRRSSITDWKRTSSGRMLLERVKVEAESYMLTLYLL